MASFHCRGDATLFQVELMDVRTYLPVFCLVLWLQFMKNTGIFSMFVS